jgi:DAACS family dicarboxylate/amino acid:cation (Na+ or H+) symporter
VVVGILVGEFLGDRVVVGGFGVGSLGAVGTVLIRVLKALATPLIFLAIVDGILRTHVPRAKGLALLGISAVNAIVAVLIGLGVAQLFRGGTAPFAEMLRQAGVASTSTAPSLSHEVGSGLGGLAPDNLIDPFRTNSVATVVVLALLFGFALRATRSHGGEEGRSGVDAVAAAVHGALQACTRVLGWMIEWLPLAVACVIASLVGKSGIAVFAGLGAFLGTILIGLLLHAIVYYGLVLRFVAKVSPFRFWRGAGDALATALSCGSSLATLPVTLKRLDAMGVSTSSARLAACVGTNLNHDGIILYEASATLFVAHALGMDLSLGAQLSVAVAAVLAGIGIAGVPEAGLITLPLVFAAGGLPASVAPIVIPLVLPVDWVIGRFRAATNVASDMTVAMLLDRIFPGGRD